MVAVALEQVEGGAQVIDINMDDGLLESAEEMRRFLNLIAPSRRSAACRS